MEERRGLERYGFPGDIPGEGEVEVVGVQIGRPTRGEIGVSGRCQFGLPVVVRTSPVLEDGTPFPTLYYLTCPVAVRDVGRLEAGGFMDEMRDALATDEELQAAYQAAHEAYLAQRDTLGAGPEGVTAGGMPGRVKCLHALYAHDVGDSNPIGSQVAERIEPIDCPGPCVADIGNGKLEAVPGHPGFKGRRARR